MERLPNNVYQFLDFLVCWAPFFNFLPSSLFWARLCLLDVEGTSNTVCFWFFDLNCCFVISFLSFLFIAFSLPLFFSARQPLRGTTFLRWPPRPALPRRSSHLKSLLGALWEGLGRVFMVFRGFRWWFCERHGKNLEEVADIWDISGDIRGSVRREKIET